MGLGWTKYILGDLLAKGAVAFPLNVVKDLIDRGILREVLVPLRVGEDVLG